MTIEKIEFNFEELVPQCLNIVDSKAKDKKICLFQKQQFNFEGLIKSDPTKIKQIIINFLSNAIKFTTTGAVCVQSQSFIKNNLNWLRIEVIDTGIGISEDKLEHLFKEYDQIDSTKSRMFGGTGLGLWISKGLAEALGGQVDVKSKVGQGSTFGFEIPVELVQKAEHLLIAKQITEEPILLLKNTYISVLVVDDNQVNRVVLGKYLKRLGLEYYEATNGAEAIEMYQNMTFDLVFMDCNMPVMNGFQATEQIRLYEKENNLKAGFIVALTASDSDEDRLNCLSSGMNHFMSKPIKNSELNSIIMELKSNLKAA